MFTYIFWHFFMIIVFHKKMYRNTGSGHHTTIQTHYQHLSLLSVKPLWIFKIQRKFNRLFVIFDLSHVFSLLAVKNDRSGVQDVAWFTKSSLISFTMLGIRFFLHSEFPFMFLYISRKHSSSIWFSKQHLQQSMHQCPSGRRIYSAKR